MSIPVHRINDDRVCGAVTVVSGNTTVYANGTNNGLIAVDGDPNSHGAGGLIAHSKNFYCEGKLVVNHTADSAHPDNLCPPEPHCTPSTAEGSPDVWVGDPV